MGRLARMIAWALSAYCYGRNKPHGVRYRRWHAFVIAATGFHIGMGWIGWWSDPMTWIYHLGRFRAEHKEPTP